MPARKPPKSLSDALEKLPFKVEFRIGRVVIATEHFATWEEASAHAASFDAKEPLYEGSSLTRGLAGNAERPSRK